MTTEHERRELPEGPREAGDNVGAQLEKEGRILASTEVLESLLKRVLADRNGPLFQ